MYIQIYKVGTKWFRKDNQTLVGNACTDTDSTIIKTIDGQFLSYVLGYTDDNNQFIPLCNGRGCLYAKNCNEYNGPICIYPHSKDPSRGMYIYIPD